MTRSLTNPEIRRSTDWLRSQLRWITVPSWLLSGIFHLGFAGLLLFLSQLPSCQRDIQGDDGDAFRDVGIHQRPSSVDSERDSEAIEESEQSELVYENPLPTTLPVQNAAPPVEMSLPQLDLAPPLLGAGAVPMPSLAQNDLLKPSNAPPTATSIGAGAPTTGGTSFLGIDDVGKRFVYVIDRSYSMENGNAFNAAKNELLASIARLNETQQFQIIFYSHEVEVLQPRDSRLDMYWGTEAQRMQVSNQLRTIRPNGGTRHLPALLKAVDFNPDVIFLLTDGAADSALSAAELQQVKQRNRGGARIHCIEFGNGPASVISGEANFLRQLAKQHQGQYTYRDVRTLQRPR